MEKVNEISTGNDFFKIYFDENLNALQFVKDIQGNGVSINYIEAMEGVEADMQTVNGIRMTNIIDFEQKFSEIELRGRELSYYIDSTYNQIPVKFSVGSNTKTIVMNSPEQSLEIEDLISQKKTR